MNQKFIQGIDGLRALAVLSVILYHLDPTWLPGGFTGVDIFFVISGYVVAKSLDSRRDLPLKSFIGDFYRRRLLRIYPALLACLIITGILVVLFIPKFHVSQSIENTALSAFFGLSNIILALDTNTYFSPGAEFNPFIHTWSLGVEEQFYLIFPFIFYFWLRKKAKYSLHVLLLISLAFCYFHTDINSNHAYYLLTSRFWELAAGAALYKFHQTSGVGQVSYFNSVTSVFIGTVTIFLSLLFADKSHFPFPWAILTVCGTCYLIHAVVIQNYRPIWVIGLFESQFAAHIGKLSYSLYLWHWPIFTLYRWTWGLESVTEMLSALILTYTFSLLSYYALEIKVPRLKLVNGLNSKTINAGGVLIITICCFFAFKGFQSQTWRSLSVTANKEVWSPYTQLPIPTKDLPLSGRTIYVLGDSHAGAYQKMLAKLSEETGILVRLYSKGGCGVTNLRIPVLVGSNPCAQKAEGWLEEVKNNATDKDIIFLATLKMYALAYQSSVYPSDPKAIVEAQLSDKSVAQRKLALKESLDVLGELSKVTPYIVMDAPKPIFNYVTFRCADWYTKSNPICSHGYEESRDFMESFRSPTLQSLLEIQKTYPAVSIWDPMPILCSKEKCSVYNDEKPLFFDADHLSGYGNELVYSSFKKHILSSLAISE